MGSMMGAYEGRPERNMEDLASLNHGMAREIPSIKCTVKSQEFVMIVQALLDAL